MAVRQSRLTEFGLHGQVINHLNWEVPDPPTDATCWPSSGRVAVYGAGLAGCWTRLPRRAQRPLNATAVSGPTAEIPQSPKRGPVSSLSAKLAKYCHIHLGISQMAGSERCFGSKGCRRWVPQCAADCNFGKIFPKLLAFLSRSCNRGNLGAIAPKSFRSRSSTSLNGRTRCRSGFVGFVGSTLAFAARMQDDDPARWMHGLVLPGSARHESWETQRKWHLQNLQNRVLMVL